MWAGLSLTKFLSAETSHRVQQQPSQPDDHGDRGPILDNLRPWSRLAARAVGNGRQPVALVITEDARVAAFDRHTLDQIATHYAVHRATVARTLAAAREQLIAGTRAGIVAAIGISPDELSSVIRALDTNFELSLSRVLAVTEPR